MLTRFSVCLPGAIADSVTMWERGRQLPVGKVDALAVRKTEKKNRFLPESYLGVVASPRGFVVTIGSVSMLLDREAAEELTCLLVDALEPTEPSDVSTNGSN